MSEPVPFSFAANQIFTFLFIMLGPLKLLAPYAKITAGCDADEARKLAVRAILVATVTVLAASFVGTAVLKKWNVSPGALAIAGGILFFSVAFSLVLSPYTDDHPAGHAAHGDDPTVVMRRLVPAVVSPHGIAAVILILTIEPHSYLLVVGILIGIMALDLVAMLFARQILKLLALPLQIVGTVMGVLQVALSVQMVIYGVRLIAVTKLGIHWQQ